ncbi:autotransporter assembly complex protein TamA [Marinicella marina]|uniref:autotransporter assembly complex protein TamA n=1 Tax=Marinicella marina TaxID=2996016 RepID=UPI002260C1E2|nr:autotransporter assembly complex family protein [Marinicella marina]
MAVNFKVVGVDKQIEANVLSFIGGKSYQCDALQSTITRQHKALKDQVKLAIQPFGYFNSSLTLKSNESNQCEPLIIDIDLGPETTLRVVDVRVLSPGDEAFDQVLKKHPMKIGQRLVQQQYEQLKSRLLELAMEKFYLDARFVEKKLNVFAEENAAEIKLIFDTGPRYRISEVKINTSQSFLDVALVNRLVAIEQNSYVTQSQLYKAKQKLNSYGYFQQVLFEVDEDKIIDGKVPLEITFSPAAKYDYSVGLGASTDRGGQASFKYNNYRVNSKGHQFSAQLNLSQVNNEFISDYKIPDKQQPANEWFNFKLGYRDQRTDNVESQTSKLGLSQTIIMNNRWQNINFIDVLHETFDTGVDQGESLLLVPGVSLSLTDADNLTRPNRGYKIQTEFKGASEDVFSDASFVQLTLFGKYIHTLGERNRMLYRARLGATASSDFDELPTTYRFFAGGDTSIRGYDFESISPLNDAGDTAGGKHLAVGSIEFEHQFAEQWAWAAFSDFGDSFSDSFDFKYSVGSGIRWFSPIGPIRVDVGVPLNQDQDDFRLHITIGPDL